MMSFSKFHYVCQMSTMNGRVLNLFETDCDTGMSWRTRVSIGKIVFAEDVDIVHVVGEVVRTDVVDEDVRIVVNARHCFVFDFFIFVFSSFLLSFSTFFSDLFLAFLFLVVDSSFEKST